MDSQATRPSLIKSANLTEYFNASVQTALDHQRVEAQQCTVYYLVNILSAYSRSERLFDRTEEGVMLRPLASFLCDAVEEPNPEVRQKLLQRLGDLALFISGIFSESLKRKPVDVDYYIAMGEGAYASLSENLRGTTRGDALCDVFDELSDKFTSFVDILNEVGENIGSSADRTLLRSYEVYLRTGSERARQHLAREGIVPMPDLSTRYQQ